MPPKRRWRWTVSVVAVVAAIVVAAVGAAAAVVVIFVAARNYMAIKLIELRALRSRQLLRLSNAFKLQRCSTKYAQQVRRRDAPNSCNRAACCMPPFHSLTLFFGIISCRLRVAHFAGLILAPAAWQNCQSCRRMHRQTDGSTDRQTDRGGKWHRQLKLNTLRILSPAQGPLCSGALLRLLIQLPQQEPAQLSVGLAIWPSVCPSDHLSVCLSRFPYNGRFNCNCSMRCAQLHSCAAAPTAAPAPTETKVEAAFSCPDVSVCRHVCPSVCGSRLADFCQRLADAVADCLSNCKSSRAKPKTSKLQPATATSAEL